MKQTSLIALLLVSGLSVPAFAFDGDAVIGGGLGGAAGAAIGSAVGGRNGAIIGGGVGGAAGAAVATSGRKQATVYRDDDRGHYDNGNHYGEYKGKHKHKHKHDHDDD